MKTELAKSLSGHDKGHFYFIWKKEGNFAFLVDGGAHPIARPKKKNARHYQVVKRIPEEILAILSGDESLSDESVRRAVRAYERLQSRKAKQHEIYQ